MTVGALVLAAGSSQRFGSDKRVAQLKTGKTLLETTVDNLRAADLPVLVCLDELYEGPKLPNSANSYICKNADQGMSSTLAEGAEQIPDWQAVLIVLADMPWVSVDSYMAIARAAQTSSIVAPYFESRRGNPVCFGVDFFPELKKLSGDRGGSQLLKKYDQQMIRLELQDPAILQDIDNPYDMKRG